MTSHDERTRRALTCACRFLDANDAKLSSINLTPARREADLALSRIDQHAGNAQRLFNDRLALTRAIHQLRAHLITAMRPAIVIGRAKLPRVPALAAVTLPTRRISTPDLTLAAHALANIVRRNEAAFVALSLPADTADQLRRLANMLERTSDLRQAAVISKRRSNLTIGQALDSAKVAASIVDALLRAHPAITPGLITEWREAREVA